MTATVGVCIWRRASVVSREVLLPQTKQRKGIFTTTSPVRPSPFGKLPGHAIAGAVMGRTSTDLSITALVMLVCTFYAMSTLNLASCVKAVVSLGEDLINAAFCVEYFMRWYSRNLRPSYVLKWEMVVDLLAFLPFLLEQVIPAEFGSLSFLRILRILRIRRFLRDRQSFAQLVGARDVDSISQLTFRLVQCITTMGMILFISSGLIYNAEHMVNSNFSNFFATAYFVLVTLTTVGFGDLHPVTAAGRAVVCLTILLGVALVPFGLAKVLEASHFLDETDDEKDTQEASFHTALLSRLTIQQQQLDLLALHFQKHLQQHQQLQPQPQPQDPVPAATPLLLPFTCRSCGEALHRLDAKFCFKCGTNLMPL